MAIVLGQSATPTSTARAFISPTSIPATSRARSEQWQAIKKAASDAIVANGGTISHHHGVGEDHLPWLEAEKGSIGVNVLRAIKRELDPAGVLNPGS